MHKNTALIQILIKPPQVTDHQLTRHSGKHDSHVELVEPFNDADDLLASRGVHKTPHSSIYHQILEAQVVSCR